MPKLYNNLPQKKSKPDYFQDYQNSPIAINPATLSIIQGFFTSRGFSDSSAKTISETIIRQSVIDGYNPLQIVDTMRSLDKVQISAIIAEILNYNRFKTSSLGRSGSTLKYPEIRRNILP